MLAAGATLVMTGVESVLAIEPTMNKTPTPPALYRYHGHARSGCAFRPEMTDIWAGGGAVLPEEF